MQAYVREFVRLTAVLFLMAIILLPLERLFAVRPRRVFSWKLAGDIGYYFISSLVPGLLLAPPLALVAVAAHAVVPYPIQSGIAAWPLWARALGALIVSEFGFYWGHRAMHEIPFLWSFHAIHHSSRDLYFLVSSRAHPFDNAFVRLCGLIPVTALGLITPITREGGVVSALLVLGLTLWGFLIHSNVRLRLGAFEWLITMPAFHHWHHTMGEHKDRNYAATLPILDWMFGTFYLPKDKWPEEYGTDTAVPASLGGQLVYPFLDITAGEGAPKPT